MGAISEPDYQAGRAAFAAGQSLRSAVERVMAAETREPEAEKAQLSFSLGFLDAALDKFRGIERS